VAKATLLLVPLFTVGLPPDVSGIPGNLLAVTAGNIFGRAGFVGVVYWIIYRRDAR
jgi:formate/nitrite transporter FocA (FNT family)